MLKISERLLAVAEMVPTGARVADIGTDHALVPCYLIKNNRAQTVIGIDLRPGPLQSARRTITEENLGGKVEIREGDGLLPLVPGEVDTVIIAGLGGATIAGILEAAPRQTALVNRLILQPMTESEKVRLWLAENNWQINAEKLLKEDDRLYEVIATQKGKGPALEERELYYGPLLIKNRHPYLRERVEKDLAGWQEILNSLANSSTTGAREKETLLKNRIELAKELKEWLSVARP